MANIRDITGKNRVFTGTDGIKLPEGTTAQRPGSPADGELRFNTTTNLAEYYDGTSWKPIDSPPTITAVSPTSWASDGATRQTFTISGSNFQSGATAKFVGSDGTEYTGVNLSVTSSSTVTIQNTTAMNVSKEPYDIIITNPSGLAATIEDAVDAGGVPSFSTSADTTVATTYEGAAANTDFNETTIKATDPDGTAVTHTISAGALPNGLSLSTAGDITGTISGSSVQTYTFTVSATDGTNVVTRQFNISNSEAPSIEYLVVAGGGGGGGSSDNQNNYAGAGGGGAGGYRTGTVSDPGAARVYTVTVGGGAGTTAYNANGASGSVSSLAGTNTFTTITSAGGGGGGRENFTGNAGGSGGGGGASNGERPYNGNAGAGNTPSVSPSQGNSGGAGRNSPSQPYGGGGGGGASQAGQPGNAPSPHDAGEGGTGTANSITGSSVTYAGGGGGGCHDGTGAEGGSGGGGRGGQHNGPQNGQAGTANLGGGGGGCGPNSPNAGDGGAGGSGVVILKVPSVNYSGTTSGSPTVNTSGDYKVITFNSSGSYTVS
jgi:hypothetical protein